VTAAVPLFDVDHVEALLQAAAAKRADFSYSELLLLLGYRFSRPKLRALCVVLDAIDRRAEAFGQPELAALVVRESDRLPGQGWWVGRHDHGGPWEGPEAQAYLAQVQGRAFAYWSSRVIAGSNRP
jgi:hypothetical protein